MKESRTNIWGKKGCQLPNGGLCESCCTLTNIEFDGIYASVSKPANSPCEQLNREQRNGMAGCSLQGKGKPPVCSWHCSTAGFSTMLDLIAQTLSSGQVSRREAVTAASKVLGRNGDSEGEIVRRSNYLSRVTERRPLVVADLDET